MFSVVIPVKNEEINIRFALNSVSGLDDVHVVDSYSTDKTVSICAEYKNVKIHLFNWNHKFPKKRNWALRNIVFKYDYVLFLDADEIVTDSFIKEARKALNLGNYSGYWITYTNYFKGRILKYGLSQRKLSLIKVGSGEYEKVSFYTDNFDMEVHEHPLIRGKVGRLYEKIKHDDFSDINKFIIKHIEYADWEVKRYQNVNNYDLTFRQKIKYLLVNTYFLGPIYFIYNYIIKFGFLDGRLGFEYSFYKMFYFLLIKFKLNNK